MKTYTQRLSKITAMALLLPVLSLSLLTGCGTPTTPPDPVRIEQVKGVLQQTVASTVLLGIQKDKKSEPYLKAVQEVFCDLAGKKMLSPSELTTALANSSADVFKTVEGQIASNAIIGTYSIYFADRLRADVSERPYVQALMETLCIGINQGIAQAKDAGLLQ